MTRNQAQPRERDEGALTRSSKGFTAIHDRRLSREDVNLVTQVTFESVRNR